MKQVVEQCMPRHHARAVLGQRLADERERVIDNAAALPIADRPQFGARMDEEQSVVQPGGQRELVALENDGGRADDKRR